MKRSSAGGTNRPAGWHYHLDVPGRPGWLARYFKELDANERTLRFGQAVHEDQGKPVEIHEKYPVDKATGNCRIPP